MAATSCGPEVPHIEMVTQDLPQVLCSAENGHAFLFLPHLLILSH